MIDVARKKPGANANDITGDGMQMFGFVDAAGQSVLSKFNLSINPSLVKLNARLLPAAVLTYSTLTTRPQLASWNLSDKGVHKLFSVPAPDRIIPVIDIATDQFEAYDQNRLSAVNELWRVIPEALCEHGLILDERQFIRYNRMPY
jgi:hypothetical protein